MPYRPFYKTCVLCNKRYLTQKPKSKYCSMVCSCSVNKKYLCGNPKGYKFSQEARRNMSLGKKGKPSSFKGKHLSDEAKKKISIANKGKKHPYRKRLDKEARLRLSLAHRGKKLSEKHKLAISRHHKQKVADGVWHAWKGGITPINLQIRGSKEYRDWRVSVFRRDNYTCQECGTRSGNGKAVVLNADHIKPFALHPKLRFELSNGRTLCLECHKKTDTWGLRANYRNNLVKS